MSEEIREPFDPATALGMIDAESAKVRKALDVNLPMQLFAWGVAWLIGFGGLWLDVRGDDPFVGPGPVAGMLFAVLLAAAGIVTGVVTRRGTRGVGGRADRAGARLGIAWGLGFGAFMVVASAVASRNPQPGAATVLFTAGCILLSGVMYVMNAAVWDDALQARLGVVLIVVAAVGTWLGPVTLLLLGAVLAGGAFMVAAAAARARNRRG